jgi:hypothetical protein
MKNSTHAGSSSDTDDDEFESEPDEEDDAGEDGKLLKVQVIDQRGRMKPNFSCRLCEWGKDLVKKIRVISVMGPQSTGKSFFILFNFNDLFYFFFFLFFIPFFLFFLRLTFECSLQHEFQKDGSVKVPQNNTGIVACQ